MPLQSMVLLLVGFFALIKGADWLVDGASAVARRFGIRDIVIGLTVVAFGTSAPELFINSFSAFSGNTDLALGNIVGSNIANILLILGVAAIIYPMTAKRDTVLREIPLSLLAAIALAVSVNDDILDRGAPALLTRTDGLVFFLFFIIFLYYSYIVGTRDKKSTDKHTADHTPWPKTSMMLVGGLAGLGIGGQLIVTSASDIATQFGLSQALIGLTIIAVGTSLPELATSAVAAWRRNSDIAIGNVVGSNIFNIFFILAITSTISPIKTPPNFNVDLSVMIIASLLLFLAMFVGFKRRAVERWEGMLFLSLYIAYIGFVAWRG